MTAAGPSRWRRWLGLALVAAIAATAGWGFHRVFPGTELLLAVVPAAAAPALVAALTAGRPLWLALMLDLVAWFAGTVPLYRGLEPGLLKDVADSWHALLTTLLPAEPDPALLVLVHTLVWSAAVAGAELLSRGATRIAAAIPALLVYGAALLLGVDGEGSNLPVAAVLVTLIGVLAVLRDGRPPLWLPAGLPVAAALAAVALFAAPLLPIAAQPYNPREHADLPPPARVDSVSPLDRVSAWLQIPDRELFTVRADRPLNWRLAVLDRYDGVRWTSAAGFRPTGGRVPEGPWTGEADLVRQRVTFGGLPGTWLPAAERPERVTGVRGLAVDPGSGALLTAGRPGKGFTYEVTSRVPRPSKEDLLAAVPAGDPALTAFPDGPQRALFRELARKAVKGAEEPMRQAYRLQSWLRTSARYDVTAPPGHSLKSLEFFLETTHRGTSEQFATTFALMARTLGLPSRVVVGFRPGTPSGGVYHVKSGHVMAWAEIEFEGLGWRPFYPTPGRSGAKDDHEVVSSAIEESEQLEGEFARGGGGHAASSEPRGDGQGERSGGGPSPWTVGAAGGGLLVLAYAGLAAALPWWRRRARRRGPDPGSRVLGAWRQARDDLGLAREHALTAEDVLAAQPPDLSPHLRPLADLSNFVRYAPDAVTDTTATAAWRHSDALRRAVRARTPLPARLRRRLLLR
ncbi:transglutaminaseTgpA domain-containing protein [Nonomuraea sp. NPDC050783]|uniref:transglutaminase family protein n=1 Tax=Nonomuraea sp. NPDC050783 TaxID=3154634 RepID=UPI0034664A4B